MEEPSLFCLHHTWLVQMKALTTGSVHEGCTVILWYAYSIVHRKLSSYSILVSIVAFQSNWERTEDYYHAISKK